MTNSESLSSICSCGAKVLTKAINLASIVFRFLIVGSLLVLPMTIHAQQEVDDGPRYAEGNSLILPADYRSWPFIGAGLGMSYDDDGGTPEQAQSPPFSHVFVNPTAYRNFMKTGKWLDGSLFVLEFRRSVSEGSINTSGHYATDLVLLEAEVKDSRFSDGWAFYTFGPGDNLAEVAEPLAGEAVAPCVQCHSTHAAVERTFVQFYPTLLEVAREKGTLNPGFSE